MKNFFLKLSHPAAIQGVLMLAALAVGIVISISGCDQQTPDSGNRAVYDVPAASALEGARFKVQSQGTFRAGYDNHEREILILTDTKTGRQYLAITGVGVTEIFQEGTGKNAHTIEE